jgi:hypothetical protein
MANKVTGALLYAISTTEGRSWGGQRVISDPTGEYGPLTEYHGGGVYKDAPQDNPSGHNHLAPVRHGVLPWGDGRWLLPLRGSHGP